MTGHSLIAMVVDRAVVVAGIAVAEVEESLAVVRDDSALVGDKVAVVVG